SLRQRKCLTRHPHRTQEAATQESVDPIRKLTPREAHKIRVVEEVLQLEIAARARHLELLKDHEGGPIGPLEAHLGHASPPNIWPQLERVAGRSGTRKASATSAQNYTPLSVIAAVSLCDGVGRTRRLVCSRVAQRLGTPLLSSEADRAARGGTCSVGA